MNVISSVSWDLWIAWFMWRLWQCQEKLKRTVEAAIVFQPHVVVTVDSKGFSFRLLKQIRGNLHQHLMDYWVLLLAYTIRTTCEHWGGFAARYRNDKLACPVHFHYVAPSFWAWKGGEERLKGLVEFVDHILCILPNEAEVCKSNGLAATFVGHPILEDTLDLNAVRYVLFLINAVYKFIIFEFNSWKSRLHSLSFILL